MSSMNHTAVIVDKNEFEMVDLAELPFGHKFSHSNSSHQSSDQMKNDVILDIEAMIQDSEEGFFSTTCCIYKVPNVVRELNEEAYTPKAVSIGPFHYGNVRLQNMERHKQIFFKRFIKEARTSLDDLVSFAEHLEPRVRACYSENIKLSKKELVKVILVDAGFVIELFRKMYKKSLLVNDAKMSKPWLVVIVAIDLLLLENQLPFFFLEELFDRAFLPHLCGDVPSFLQLTYSFFADYNMQELNLLNGTIMHFTDLLRFFHLQEKKPKRDSTEAVIDHVLSYSATELQEAGVKFKKSTSKCLLDLKFSRHVLEVPQILVETSTETIFRNMIALEQCHYPSQSHITDYALVLDCLINTKKDVNVLIHAEILRNYLSDSKDVAKVINGLWKNTTQWGFNSDYLDICKRLNDFYKDPWHNKKATLRRDYCNTPWRTAASMAAITLLILSLVQAIFSILDYSK